MSFNPLLIIKKAVKVIPEFAIIYCLLGILAAAKIGHTWGFSIGTLIITVTTFIILFVIIHLFLLMAGKEGKGDLHPAVHTMMWIAVIVVILVFSSFFFNNPIQLRHVIESAFPLKATKEVLKKESIAKLQSVEKKLSEKIKSKSEELPTLGNKCDNFPAIVMRSNNSLKNKLKIIYDNCISQKNDPTKNLLVVHAPAGYGKSFIIKDYLKNKIKNKLNMELVTVKLKHVATARNLKNKKEVIPEYKVFSGPYMVDIEIKNSSSNATINKIPSIKNLNINTVKDLIDSTISHQKVKDTSEEIRRIVIFDDLDEVIIGDPKKLNQPNFIDILTQYLKKNPQNYFIVLGRTEAFLDILNSDQPKTFLKLESPLNPPIFYKGELQIRIKSALNYLINIKKEYNDINSVTQKHIDDTLDQVKIYLENNSFLWLNLDNTSYSEHLIKSAFEKKFESTLSKDVQTFEKDPRLYFSNHILYRNTKTHNRPSEGSAYQTEYYKALYEIAYKTALHIDKNGYFSVATGLSVKIGSSPVSIEKILQFSGLIKIKPADSSSVQYRFEPMWLHRYFVEKYQPE